MHGTRNIVGNQLLYPHNVHCYYYYISDNDIEMAVVFQYVVELYLN